MQIFFFKNCLVGELDCYRLRHSELCGRFLWLEPKVKKEISEKVRHDVLLQGEHEGHVAISANQILFN